MSELGQVIRNRVTEMRVISAGELQGREGNWRLHPRFQRDALRGILESIGIAGALTAFYSEAQGGLTLIDGHLRKEDYPDTGWPVLILDVDDAEADVLLATLDPIAALAEAESSALDALLKTVETESAAVKALLERLAGAEEIDYDELWQGMPEFEQEDLGPKRTLMVHFADEGDIASFAELIGQRITGKTKYIWYPRAKRADLTKFICEDES